jgi:hypothetical protein
MVVACIIGKQPPDGEAFSALIRQVDPQHIEFFRQAARRLSQWTYGSLHDALKQFNFDHLGDQCNCPECSGRLHENDLDGIDMHLPDLSDEEMTDPLQAVLKMVETYIDMIQLRGARENIIKKQRKVLMNDYHVKAMLKDVAELLPPYRMDELSPEARILIYG